MTQRRGPHLTGGQRHTVRHGDTSQLHNMPLTYLDTLETKPIVEALDTIERITVVP